MPGELLPSGPLPTPQPDYSADIQAHLNHINDPATKAATIVQSNPTMASSPDAAWALAHTDGVSGEALSAGTKYMGLAKQVVDSAHATGLADYKQSSGPSWFDGLFNDAAQVIDSINPIGGIIGNRDVRTPRDYISPASQSVFKGWFDDAKSYEHFWENFGNTPSTAIHGVEAPFKAVADTLLVWNNMEHSIAFYRSLQKRYGTTYASQYFATNLLPALLTKGALGVGEEGVLAAGEEGGIANSIVEKAAGLRDKLTIQVLKAMKAAGKDLTPEQESELMQAELAQAERDAASAAREQVEEERRARVAKLHPVRRIAATVARGVASPLRLAMKAAEIAFRPGQDVTTNLTYQLTGASSMNNPQTSKLWQQTADGTVINPDGSKGETAGNAVMDWLGATQGTMAFQIGSDVAEFYSKWLGSDALGAAGKVIGQARSAEGFTSGLMSKMFGGMGIKDGTDMFRAFFQYARVRAAVNYMASHDITDILSTFRNFFDFSTDGVKAQVTKIAESHDPQEITGILADLAEGSGLVRNVAPSLTNYELFKAMMTSKILDGRILSADYDFIRQISQAFEKGADFELDPSSIAEAAGNETTRARATFGRWLVKQFTRKALYFDEITKAWQDFDIIPGSRNAIPAISDNLKALAMPQGVVDAAVEALWKATPEEYQNIMQAIYFHAGIRRAMAGLGHGNTDAILSEAIRFMKEVVRDEVGKDGAGSRGAQLAGDLATHMSENVTEEGTSNFAAIGDSQLGKLRMPDPRTIRGLGVKMRQAIINFTRDNVSEAYNLTRASIETLDSAAKFSNADLKGAKEEIGNRATNLTDEDGNPISIDDVFPPDPTDITLQIARNTDLTDFEWMPIKEIKKLVDFNSQTFAHITDKGVKDVTEELKKDGFPERIKFWVHPDTGQTIGMGGISYAYVANESGITHVPVTFQKGLTSSTWDYRESKMTLPTNSLEDYNKPSSLGLKGFDEVPASPAQGAYSKELKRIMDSIPEIAKKQTERNQQFVKFYDKLRSRFIQNEVTHSSASEILGYEEHLLAQTPRMSDRMIKRRLEEYQQQLIDLFKKNDIPLPDGFSYEKYRGAALDKLEGKVRAQQEALAILSKRLDTDLFTEQEIRDHIAEYKKLVDENKAIDKEQVKAFQKKMERARTRNPKFLNRWQRYTEASNRLLSSTFVPIALASGGWAIRVSASEALLNSFRDGGFDSLESRIITSIAMHESRTAEDVKNFYTYLGQRLDEKDAKAYQRLIVGTVAHALVGVRELVAGVTLGVKSALIDYSDIGTQRMINNFTSAILRHDGALPMGVHSQLNDVMSDGYLHAMSIYGQDENGKAIKSLSFRGRDFEHVTAGVGSGINGYFTALFEHLTRISQDSFMQPNMQELSNILRNIGFDKVAIETPVDETTTKVFQGAKNIAKGANKFYDAGGTIKRIEDLSDAQRAEFRMAIAKSQRKAEQDTSDFLGQMTVKYFGPNAPRQYESDYLNVMDSDEVKTYKTLKKNESGHEAMNAGFATREDGFYALDSAGNIQGLMTGDFDSYNDVFHVGYIGSRGLMPGTGDALQLATVEKIYEKSLDDGIDYDLDSTIGYGSTEYHKSYLHRNVSGSASNWDYDQIEQIVKYYHGLIKERATDKTIQELVAEGAKTIKTAEQQQEIMQKLEEAAFRHIRSMPSEVLERFDRNTGSLKSMFSTRGEIDPLTGKPFPESEISHRDWARAIAHNTMGSVSGIGKDGVNIYPELIEQAKNGEVEAPDLLQKAFKKIPRGAEPKNIPARMFVDRDPLGDGSRFDFFNKISDKLHDKLLGPIVNSLSRNPIWLLEYHNAYENLRPLVESGFMSIEQAEVKADVDATINMTKYVHNPKDKAIFEQNMRVFAPFYFAQNQSWRRAFRVLRDDPGAFEKYLKACMGVTNVVAAASQNGNGVMGIPGTEFVGGVAGYMNKLESPFARMMFGLAADPTSVSSVVPTGSEVGWGMVGNIVRPSWGPFVSIAFKEAQHFLGFDHLPFANKLAQLFLGNADASQSIWGDITPSAAIRNTVTGIEGMFGNDSSAMGSAMNQALNEALDNKFAEYYDQLYSKIKDATNVPHSEITSIARTYADMEMSKFMSNPQNKQNFLLQARHAALYMYIIKTALGFFSPVALTLQSNFSQYPAFQKLLDEKNPNGTPKYMFPEASQLFAQTNPTGILDLVAHTSSTYSPYPETQSAIANLTNYPNVIQQYPYASAYTINRNSNFSPAAYQLELELNLRQREAPQDYYNSLMVALGNDLYYNWYANQYPDNGTSEQSYKNYKELQKLASNYGNLSNPIWYDQFSGSNRHYAEANAAIQMQDMVDDKSVPDAFFGGEESRLIYKALTEQYFQEVAKYNAAASSTEQSNIASSWYTKMNLIANEFPQQAYYITGVLAGLPNKIK
jgi:hypothetical protein